MVFELYDIESKKDIILKNISFTDKQKIINGEFVIKTKIKNLDKFKYELSKDDTYLPMFDIIDEKIYLIHKNYIFKSIKHNNMRVLNNNLIDFFENNKYDKKIINITHLFDFELLETQFLNFIYYHSKDVGQDISYFKNPAFIKNADIRPYLKKSSIINTGLNTGILKIKDLPINDINLEDIYHKIKPYLFTDKILYTHKNLIKKHKTENLLSFFSLYGSFFINKYLRNINQKYNDNMIIEHINKMNLLISEVPRLDEDKIVFRYINDDSFLNLDQPGDTFINDSFMSCTRKPNINAQNNEFGYILLKINLTTKFKGYFISIESESVFNKEKEVIIKPGVEFRLKSVDDDVDFYLFEKKYLRNIKKKYELEVINIHNIKIPKYEIISIPEFNINEMKLEGNTLDEKIKFFYFMYCNINKSCYIKYGKKRKLFYFNFYDSTELYSDFYYYKITNGFFILSFDDNNNIDTFIELGDDLIINYPSHHLNLKKNADIKIISALFCNLFEISTIKIFPYHETIDNTYYNIVINELLQDIINDDNEKYDIYDNKKIINFFNSKVDINHVNFNILKYINENTTYKSLMLDLMKNNKIYLKYLYKSFPINILKCHYVFYPYEYLLDESYIEIIPYIYSTYAQTYEETNITDNTNFDMFERSIIKN